MNMQQYLLKNNSQHLEQQLNDLVSQLQTAVDELKPAHDVEQWLWRSMLQLGHQWMTLFFELHGDVDLGETTTRENGRTLKRLATLRHRDYLSVFGNIALSRVAYGSREEQKIEYIPLDERLQLPLVKHSYLLQEWDQTLVMETPFARGSAGLNRILELKQSVHTLERNHQHLSEPVETFWAEQKPQPVDEEGQFLVGSADGKGVPMCHTAAEFAPVGSEISAKIPHQDGRKKMALLGAVYSINAHSRTPEEFHS